jgi:hypothetical protein
MNDKLSKQVDKIITLEKKLNSSILEIGLLREQEQIVVSKKNEIENAQTVIRSQLQEAYTRMKEIILKDTK